MSKRYFDDKEFYLAERKKRYIKNKEERKKEKEKERNVE